MITGYADRNHRQLHVAAHTAMSNTMPQILLILLAFCEKNIVRYAILVFSMLPGVGFLSEFILPTLYISLILLSVKSNAKVGLYEFAVPIFMVFAIVLSCIIYPQNEKYIIDSNNFWNTIFPCLRWYIVGLIIVPDRAAMDLLGKVSCMAVAVETAFLILYMIPNGLVVSDDMSRAYQLLPNIMLVFNYAFNSKKIFAWIFSLIGLLYLLSLGTRGPFLILIAYVVIKLLRSSGGSTSQSKKILSILGIGVVGVGISIPTVRLVLLKSLRQVVEWTGLSTRVVDFMLDGSLVSYTSGRENLYEVALQKIQERPLLGYGIYGEWQWFGWNVHNMYLELWVHFGIILGSVLLIWCIALVAKSYFKTNSSDSKDLISIFSCFVFLRGIFGGSYLMYGMFFLIALCIREKRRINSRQFEVERRAERI